MLRLALAGAFALAVARPVPPAPPEVIVHFSADEQTVTVTGDGYSTTWDVVRKDNDAKRYVCRRK